MGLHVLWHFEPIQTQLVFGISWGFLFWKAWIMQKILYLSCLHCCSIGKARSSPLNPNEIWWCFLLRWVPNWLVGESGQLGLNSKINFLLVMASLSWGDNTERVMLNEVVRIIRKEVDEIFPHNELFSMTNYVGNYKLFSSWSSTSAMHIVSSISAVISGIKPNMPFCSDWIFCKWNNAWQNIPEISVERLCVSLPWDPSTQSKVSGTRQYHPGKLRQWQETLQIGQGANLMH